MTTPTAPPVQFIANLHHAASCLANDDPTSASTYLVRAMADAPTLELRKLTESAMMEAQLGLPERAEFYIAQALGEVEIKPIHGEMEDEPWADMARTELEKVENKFKKLQADRDRLLLALKEMVSLHAGQEHLYGLTKSGETLYRDCDALARAAIKEYEAARMTRNQSKSLLDRLDSLQTRFYESWLWWAVMIGLAVVNLITLWQIAWG